MAIPTVDPARYDEQLAEKQAYVESTFAAFDTPAWRCTLRHPAIIASVASFAFGTKRTTSFTLCSRSTRKTPKTNEWFG